MKTSFVVVAILLFSICAPATDSRSCGDLFRKDVTSDFLTVLQRSHGFARTVLSKDFTNRSKRFRVFGNPRVNFRPVFEEKFKDVYRRSRASRTENALLELYSGSELLYSAELPGVSDHIEALTITKSLLGGLEKLTKMGRASKVDRIVFTHAHWRIGSASWSNRNGNGDIPFSYGLKAIAEAFGLDAQVDMILVRDSFLKPGQPATIEAYTIAREHLFSRGDFASEIDAKFVATVAHDFYEKIWREQSAKP